MTVEPSNGLGPLAVEGHGLGSGPKTTGVIDLNISARGERTIAVSCPFFKHGIIT